MIKVISRYSNFENNCALILFWSSSLAAEPRCISKLRNLGLKNPEQRIAFLRAEQSERAGVSLDYLLSNDFASLARSRTMLDNPTFKDMESAFWLQNDPIGRDVICPRDGRVGCALVDWIPRIHRREQTHFMSWSWMYSLELLCSALNMFMRNRSSDGDRVFFFMDFFVNNQFRIHVGMQASEKITDMLEFQIRRSGKMVAVLDTWQDPIYLQRIWTVYEQFVACSLEIPVTFVMPESASASLHRSVFEEGIQEVLHSLTQIDVASAQASDPHDRIKIKHMIQETFGFESFNEHVRRVMQDFIRGFLSDDMWRATPDLMMQAAMKELEAGLWGEDERMAEGCVSKLLAMGLSEEDVAVKMKEMKASQLGRHACRVRNIILKSALVRESKETTFACANTALNSTFSYKAPINVVLL